MRIKHEYLVKLLAEIIDDKLKFNRHIDVLCKNTNTQINVLYLFRNELNIAEREVMHNGFVLANFNYCSIVWHFCDKASINKLKKTQERTLQFYLMTRKTHIPFC